MSRLYIVTDKETNKEHLVEAESQSQSVGVVVGERYESRAASALDAAKLMQAGVPLLSAPKRAPKEVVLPVVGVPAGAVASTGEGGTVVGKLKIVGEAKTTEVAGQTVEVLSKEHANAVMNLVAAEKATAQAEAAAAVVAQS